MPKPGSTSQRGYGYKHRVLRERWAAKISRGDVACWRCGKLIDPAESWDLGHDDTDRSRYRGPEHQACNRAAGRRKALQRLRRVTSRRW